MSVAPEDFVALLDEAGVDSESLTFLVVADGTRESLLSALGAEAEVLREGSALDFENFSAYAVAEVNGGVIAIEQSGYADPSNEVLARLSADGGAAAVARSNIQAHERFGCARNGELVFDDDEYIYIEAEDKDRVPPELLDLFDSAWVDLDTEDEDDDGGDHAGVIVGMAMVTRFTGVQVTADDLRRATESGYHRVPTLTYLG